MSSRISKRLGFENLEQRKLLAADLAADIMHCDLDQEPVSQCEVAMDLVDDSSMIDLSIDAAEDIANSEQAAPRIQEFDLSDGSDGVFESMDGIENHGTFSFQAETDGIVDVVVASSFGEASTSLEVRDSNDELVSASVTEGLDNFHTLRFDVSEGESYQLTISTEEGVEGNYQVTVSTAANTVENMDGSDADETLLDEDLEIEPIGDEQGDSDPVSEITTDENCDDDVPMMGFTGDETSEEAVVEDSEYETENTAESGATVVLDAPLDDSGTASEAESNLESDFESEADLQPVADTNENVQEPNGLDLHADEVGANSTELSLATGRAKIIGQLESAGDVDTFRMTPGLGGSIQLLLADVSSDCDMDINVSVFDSDGNTIAEGATNEVVRMNFDVAADSEFFVSVTAGEGQTGEYALIAKLQWDEPTVDDHANETGAQATELIFANGTWNASGVLETAEDQDAFRFTAECSETMTLGVNIDSQDNQSLAQVSILDQDGELIVQGSTNSGVDLAFDTVAGVEYQILVDSINDVPSTFELTAKSKESSEDDGSALAAELVSDAIDDCLEDLAGCDEAGIVDQVFAEADEDALPFGSTLDTMSNASNSGVSSWLRSARRI